MATSGLTSDLPNFTSRRGGSAPPHPPKRSAASRQPPGPRAQGPQGPHGPLGPPRGPLGPPGPPGGPARPGPPWAPAATDVSDVAKNVSDVDQNHDITGVDDAAKGTLPSNESDMATMAIPIEELRKGDARFQEFSKDDPNKLSASGDNPSLTLPENSDANDLVGSNESTAAAQEPVQDDNREPGDFSYTADTVGLAPEDAEAYLPQGQAEIDTRDFTKNLVIMWIGKKINNSQQGITPIFAI